MKSAKLEVDRTRKMDVQVISGNLKFKWLMRTTVQPTFKVGAVNHDTEVFDEKNYFSMMVRRESK